MTALAVLGAGAFGTALAVVAARAGARVSLIGRDPVAMAAMAAARRNETYLPGLDLPEAIEFTCDPRSLSQVDAVVIAVPTQGLRAAGEALAGRIAPGLPVIAAAKGIEQASGAFVTAILGQSLPAARAAILSGPSFAADIVRGLPTAVTLAASDLALAARLAGMLSVPSFRIYHTDDVTGVEIGGAAKNVLAIAAGIVVGSGLGESARAALIARGFAELRRFANALGARPETLMGLSGLGDLILTAASSQSRNFAYGVAAGRGEPAPAGKLAEGVFTAPALVAMARRHGVEMPICEAVAGIVSGRVTVRQAIAGLIERPQKSEF